MSKSSDIPTDALVALNLAWHLTSVNPEEEVTVQITEPEEGKEEEYEVEIDDEEFTVTRWINPSDYVFEGRIAKPKAAFLIEKLNTHIEDLKIEYGNTYEVENWPAIIDDEEYDRLFPKPAAGTTDSVEETKEEVETQVKTETDKPTNPDAADTKGKPSPTSTPADPKIPISTSGVDASSSGAVAASAEAPKAASGQPDTASAMVPASIRPAIPPSDTGRLIPYSINPAALAELAALAPSSMTVPSTMIQVSSNVEDTVARLVSSFASAPLLDPTFADTIGKKNISTYRALFMRMVSKAKLSTEACKIVIQISMHIKNKDKIMAFLKSDRAKDKASIDAIFREVTSFFETSTQTSTSAADTLMPVVKIPDSFPEICAIIFTQCNHFFEMTDEQIADELPKFMWASSLAFSAPLQAINKTSVAAQWNSWAASGGKKVNRAGKTLGFDEGIYQNSVADQIPLLDLYGRQIPIPSGGYAKEDLVQFSKMWREIKPLFIMEATSIKRE